MNGEWFLVCYVVRTTNETNWQGMATFPLPTDRADYTAIVAKIMVFASAEALTRTKTPWDGTVEVSVKPTLLKGSDLDGAKCRASSLGLFDPVQFSWNESNRRRYERKAPYA